MSGVGAGGRHIGERPQYVNRQNAEEEPVRSESRPAVLTHDKQPAERPSTAQGPVSSWPKPIGSKAVPTERKPPGWEQLCNALANPVAVWIDQASEAMAQHLDGNKQYKGGLRKLLWDAEDVGETAKTQLLGLYELASALPGESRGKYFMAEARKLVPRAKPKPAQLMAPVVSSGASASADVSPTRTASLLERIQAGRHGHGHVVQLLARHDRGPKQLMGARA